MSQQQEVASEQKPIILTLEYGVPVEADGKRYVVQRIRGKQAKVKLVVSESQEKENTE